MLFRCMILKALRKFYDVQPYPDAWLDPTSLPLWKDAARKNRGTELGVAFTKLLQEGLVLGSSTAETPLLVRLNPDKLAEINSACAWDWRYWAMLIVAILAAVAGFLALPGILEFLRLH